MTHEQEEKRLRAQDRKVLDDAICWLSAFWWTNRKHESHPDYARDRAQAGYESDRAVMAIINLKI
jgi:hypothetical protein